MVVNVTGGAISPEERKIYVDYVKEKFPYRDFDSIDIKLDGEYVDLSWVLKEAPPFERIRRITGYLVGTLDRWNNGKRAEEADRVKHSAVDPRENKVSGDAK